MDLYIIIFILFVIVMLGIIMGALFFVMWIDKKIDKRERMGQSAYRPKPNKKDSADDMENG